jgi:hypothetical protein
MRNNDLVLRQQRLLVRSAQLRGDMANLSQAFIQPLAIADQARAGLQWLYRNPLWPVGALAVLIVLRPRRALVWSSRVWWGWRTFLRFRNLLGQAERIKHPNGGIGVVGSVD